MYLEIELKPTLNLNTLLAEYVKLGKGKPKSEKKKIRKEYDAIKKEIKVLRKQYYKDIGKKCVIENKFNKN